MRMAVTQSKRRDENFAVLTIDLDNFKFINDTYGHAEGDLFLIEIARRISTAVREGDTLLRLGGDEFVLVAINTTSATDAVDVAKRVLGSISGPFALGDSIVVPGLSIGIALYPRHGTTAEALIKASDKAMYVAKRAGKNGYAIAKP
jgi:diguanylate cyclase (GGDEF)-like protein